MPTKTKFNFYDNSMCISFENPKKKGSKEPMKADFLMEGNADYLTNGLIEQMERHPQLAKLLTNASFNYLERNGKP